MLDAPKHPFVAVLGGAKVSDKLGVIDALLERCDTILVGGAMAFTFLAAQGHGIGDSLVEPDRIDDCRRLLETGRVQVPVDVVIAQEMTETAPTRIVGAGGIADGWKGLDIGPETAAIFSDAIAEARMVLWNGPMGVFELAPFASGTKAIADRGRRLLRLHDHRRRRQRRGDPPVRSRGRGRPREHRRRRVARAHRAGRPPRPRVPLRASAAPTRTSTRREGHS